MTKAEIDRMEVLRASSERMRKLAIKMRDTATTELKQMKEQQRKLRERPTGHP